MSPRTGTLVRPLVTSSWSRPPMASVSPLLMSTFESSVRLSMTGLATVAPAKVKVASPTLLLISGFTLRVMKSSLLIDGVTTSVLPNSLSWNPPKTACRGLLVEVQLRHRLIADDLDLRLLVVGGDDRGLARNSASASSFRARSVTDICGTRKDGELAGERAKRAARTKKLAQEVLWWSRTGS